MNTIRSTWIGWGALCIAGGGAYYFAKQQINADRQARYEADMKRKAQMAAMEAEHRRKEAQTPSDSPSLKRATIAQKTATGGADDAGSPSSEASRDPAPTRHEPETVLEKSKYEAAETFRPPKGNRFS